MKRLIIITALLFGCSGVFASGTIQQAYEVLDQCRELEQTLQNFMGIAMNGFKYQWCDPGSLENVCEERELTSDQKLAMKAKAKLISAEWRAKVDSVDDWIQGQ